MESSFELLWLHDVGSHSNSFQMQINSRPFTCLIDVEIEKQ